MLVLSHHFFGIPPFGFYALAEGIKKLLSRCIPSPPAEPRHASQFELVMGWEGKKNKIMESNFCLAVVWLDKVGAMQGESGEKLRLGHAAVTLSEGQAECGLFMLSSVPNRGKRGRLT